jgi:small ligand-binding sensory domain FIST
MSDSPTMTCAAVVETDFQRSDVAKRLAESVREELGDQSCDLALMFASAHWTDNLEEIAAEFAESLRPQCLIGVTAETVACGQVEYESRPALAVFAATLPGVPCRSFHMSQSDLQQFETPQAIAQYLDLDPAGNPTFILIADPFSIDSSALLEHLADAFPLRPVLGGVASAGRKPNENVLVFDGYALRSGAVGVAIPGDAGVSAVVSQGCRPIAQPYVITRAEKNVIMELGGRPAGLALRDVLNDMTENDAHLAHTGGVFIGRVVDEAKGEFARGDFIIRNLTGMDRETGALAITDFIRPGQTVQFHVRDAESADADLRGMLGPYGDRGIAGSLLFTCNGRGTRLFDKPNHDAELLGEMTDAAPSAGFFAAGEFGPIGHHNFIHGHTASIALFHRIAADAAD